MTGGLVEPQLCAFGFALIVADRCLECCCGKLLPGCDHVEFGLRELGAHCLKLGLLNTHKDTFF